MSTTAASMIDVAIVEDDARIRNVLTEVLDGAPDCRCAAVFCDGQSAIAQLPAVKPHVVIMDVNLPDVSGVECVEHLAPQLPGVLNQLEMEIPCRLG